ncbi:hypothetical protein D1007_35332 [Hordeum vulgare]|nr:hypothetical protein D1007_35332 [Hordeum vulgare]
MDARAGSPLTPSYSREPSAVAAAANPSAGSVGLASAGAPLSINLARSLFTPSRMTSAARIVAPAPAPAAMKPSTPPSKLPNAAQSKKGKTSTKKNKSAGGSGTSKMSRKKLAGRVMRGEAAPEAPASSFLEPAADGYNVFDDVPQSVNDDAYMSTMGVARTIRIVKYYTKLVQRRGEEDQEGEDKERKAIYLASLLRSIEG